MSSSNALRGFRQDWIRRNPWLIRFDGTTFHCESREAAERLGNKWGVIAKTDEAAKTVYVLKLATVAA